MNAIPDRPSSEPEAQGAEDRIVAALLAKQQLKDVDLARARRLQEETGGGGKKEPRDMPGARKIDGDRSQLWRAVNRTLP